MTRRNLDLTLNKKCEELYKCDINVNKCKFITLTYKDDVSFEKVNDDFANFIKVFRREFGNNIDYIRTIEIQKKSKRFHIHCIFVFENNLPVVGRQWLVKHWKHGISYQNKIIKDIYGVIDYITIDKNTIEDRNSPFTRYPKNARVIVSTLKPNNEEILEKFITEDQLKDLLYYSTKINKRIPKCQKHFYKNENNQIVECLDKHFIRLSKEFIEDNFKINSDNRLQ